MPREVKTRKGPDDEDRDVVAHAFGEGPQRVDLPDLVEGVLDLLHERDDGVEEQRHAHHAEYADLRVVHETHDGPGDLAAALAERCEHLEQEGFDLVVDAEALEDGEADGEQRDQREQRGVDEGHGAERELALEQIVAHRPGRAREAEPCALRQGQAGTGPPEPVLDPCRDVRVRCELHGVSRSACRVSA
jgi:hypothetical protein